VKRRARGGRDRADRASRTAGATRGEWVLGRRPAPFIIEKPAPYRPELRVLLDTGTDRMIALEPGEPVGSALEFALWAAGKVRPGTRLRVDEQEVAEALRQRLGGEVEVREAPTPEVDWALEAFAEYAGEAEGGPVREPEWADGAAPDAKAGFYDAAARFERAAPWEKAGDGQVLAVDVPEMGWTGACVSLLGQAEETFGLLVLRSLADYVQFVRVGDAFAEGPRRPPGPGVPLFSINFDRPRDLPGGKKLAKEARAHGFVPGPRGRVPYILKFGADSVPTPASTDDYRLATAFLVAVYRFVERHPDLFVGPPQQQIEERSVVLTPGGGLEVVVTQYLRMPKATLRAWAVGQGDFQPVLSVQNRGRVPLLSFVNVVEAYVLNALRREHEIPLRKGRAVLRLLNRLFPGGEAHPLADRDLLTEGREVFVEHLGALVSVPRCSVNLAWS